LNGLKVIQQANPHPAVADLAMMRFHIQLKELFSRRVVADVLLSHPKVHIDQMRLVAEMKTKFRSDRRVGMTMAESATPFADRREQASLHNYLCCSDPLPGIGLRAHWAIISQPKGAKL
jgi:hypothetical protein